jgi:radical SAM protein with 4Fe4S-binding SPASM domain
MKLIDYGFSVIQIETKSSCNMACQFCPYPLREDKTALMDDDLVYKTIDQVSNMDLTGFEYITFSQFNEPLLDKRIFDYVEYAHKHKLKTYFVTNALLLSKSSVREQLLDVSPSIIKISLQTINKYRDFGAIRGITMDIDKYFNTIYAFLSGSLNCSSRINIDIGSNFLSKSKYIAKKLLGVSFGDPSVAMNLGDLEDDIIQFLDGLVQYDSTFKYNRSLLGEFLMNTSVDYVGEEGFALAPNIRLKIKKFIYGRRIQEYLPAYNRFSCNNRILGILSDGSVVPCCLAYDDSISMGNINEKTLEEILSQGTDFLGNLRGHNNCGKHETCKKCFGEPTKRGLAANMVYEELKHLVRRG